MTARRSSTHPDAVQLIEGVTARDRASVARAISLVERGSAEAEVVLRALRRKVGHAHRVGVTGPPGAGKSSLLGALAGRIAAAGRSVGVLAVDPSSEFTHGAVLGDRIRMADLDRTDAIFIRSMASRGQGGGLGPRTDAAADVLDAAGFDWLFIESVGVGQVELDIRIVVDTTMVVLVPESGDQVQAIKAGLMEIADLYVVNKIDRPASGAMVAAVQSCVAQQHHPDPDWMPRVLGAAAATGDGIDAVLSELGRHREHLAAGTRLQQRRRKGLMARLKRRVEHGLAARLFTDSTAAALELSVERILSGDDSLEDAAEGFIAGWMKNIGGGAGRK